MLFEDRVCLRGWTWRGRYRRVIPLERIDRVQWRAVLDDANLLLHLDDGRVLGVRLLSGAGTWNVKMHGLLGQSMLAHAPLPDVDKKPVPRDVEE